MSFLRIVFLLVGAFSFSNAVLAQDNTDEWDIIERCLELNYPTIPQERWDFEGVIISRNQYGLHAIRTDFNTSYYIALDSETSFTSIGDFSPDGRWFAYPLGYRFSWTWTSTYYRIDRLRVISTTPRGTRYEIPWTGQTRRSSGSGIWGDELSWLDSETLLAFGNPGRDNFRDRGSDWFVYPFSREIEPVPEDLEITRQVERSIIYNTVEGVMLMEGDNEVIILPTDTMWVRDPAVSPDERFAGFFAGNNLYIIDIEGRQIFDLCVEAPRELYESPMWSPDGQTLAFLFDGYPVLINVETLENQILRYQTSRLIAWFPVHDD